MTRLLTAILTTTLLLAAVPAAIPAAIPASAAVEDFEVQSSNLATHKPGDKMAKGTIIALPDGATLAVIDRTGAAIVIRECKGKYDGPIETCSGKANGRAGVIPGGTRGGIR